MPVSLVGQEIQEATVVDAVVSRCSKEPAAHASICWIVVLAWRMGTLNSRPSACSSLTACEPRNWPLACDSKPVHMQLKILQRSFARLLRHDCSDIFPRSDFLRTGSTSSIAGTAAWLA